MTGWEERQSHHLFSSTSYRRTRSTAQPPTRAHALCLCHRAAARFATHRAAVVALTTWCSRVCRTRTRAARARAVCAAVAVLRVAHYACVLLHTAPAPAHHTTPPSHNNNTLSYQQRIAHHLLNNIARSHHLNYRQHSSTNWRSRNRTWRNLLCRASRSLSPYRLSSHRLNISSPLARMAPGAISCNARQRRHRWRLYRVTSAMFSMVGEQRLHHPLIIIAPSLSPWLITT